MNQGGFSDCERQLIACALRAYAERCRRKSVSFEVTNIQVYREWNALAADAVILSRIFHASAYDGALKPCSSSELGRSSS